jgi:hypothetical protein
MLGGTIVLKTPRRSDIIGEDVQRYAESFLRAWLVGTIALGVQGEHREPAGDACPNTAGKMCPDRQFKQFSGTDGGFLHCGESGAKMRPNSDRNFVLICRY